MDDPWGSPWADEAPGTAKKLDEARPKPIVIATEKQLPFDSGPRSPWDDDEDDGNWSANLDHVVQPKQNLQREERGQTFDDPWAQLDVQADDRSSPGLTHQALEPATNLDADSYRLQGDLGEVTDNSPPRTERELKSLEESAQPEAPPFQDGDKKSLIAEPPAHEKSDAHPQPPVPEIPEKDAPPCSRPSSSLSGRSHHQEATHDSPQTTPDKEPQTTPSETKDTSKVKELVQLFDGLAVESPGTPERCSNEDLPLASPKPTPEDPSPAETEDEFGDFEDGVSFVSAGAKSDEAEVSADAPTTVQPAEQPIISRPEHRRTFERGSVKFDIDRSIVDRLYSDKETSPDTTNYGPSNIDNPADSLLTVEQRKVWYRISRYGTMRKHNSGDDDTYVRMGWQHSKVREETLDIVHKWMAEGRLGTGMSLGEVGRVEAMFSWGKPGQSPNKEALHVARKASQSSKVKQSPLHTSPPRQSAHDAKPAHRRKKSSVSSIKSIVSSPVEPNSRFSWSTAQPASPDPATTITSASSESHPESFRREPVIAPISKALESPSPVPVAIEPLKPKSAAPPTLEQRKESISKAKDDDDEWGEMVASPATPNFPDLSSFPSSSQSNAPSNTIPGFSDVGMSNNHAKKHFRNVSLGNQITASVPPKPFDMDAFVPKASNRSSLGDLSKLTSHSEDPWASADFSFFESPSTAPTSVPTSKPPPYTSKPPPFATKATPVAPKDVPVLAKPMSPQTPPAPSAGRKSKTELEQDKLVRDIINGLPDFSYMLR
ncbi:hypothetical protein V492_05260 [Pseudogymnoascus sp. VKM F-4246]|nr:hypothetical protein V492_05260 [Pseudogymnoascus sp. VKM F-4246]